MTQPLRWAVAGAVMLALVGVIYGGLESIRDYAVSSWFGVTLYVGLLGAVAGLALGFVAGSVQRLLSSEGRR